MRNPLVTLLVLTALAAVSSRDIVSAQAGGLFEELLGRSSPARLATPTVPPSSESYTPLPRITVTPKPLDETGERLAYCVRLCDGRHFPLPRLASPDSTPADMCKALCPATKVRVYWGYQITLSVSSNGSRYSDLDTALKYRSTLVDGCTCNGNDVFGTAAVSVLADLTLRPGDFVATEKGYNVFVGSSTGVHRPADFKPARTRLSSTSQKPPSFSPRPLPSTPQSLRPLTLNTRIILNGILPRDRPAPSDYRKGN
jgi:Protein of unknown function (DUF2865)